jgi:short-chain fatty acids transporter
MTDKKLGTPTKGAGAQPSEADASMTPVQRFGEAVADVVERWMPSPLIFAILLTLIAAVASMISEKSTVLEIAQAWKGGFWSLLQFAMQMTVMLVAASVVAYHPKVRAVISKIVLIPRTGRAAVITVGLGAMVVGWLNWSLGLIFGAILAREMGKRAYQTGMTVHYPLLAVAGYMGMSLTWGWGPSQSAGLLQATPGNIFMQQGIVDRVIPATEWTFHPYPLILTGMAIAVATLFLFLLTPPARSSRGIEQYLSEADLAPIPEPTPATEKAPTRKQTPAERIDNSRLLGGLIGLTGLGLFFGDFYLKGFSALDLNLLNFGLVMVGIALYLSPAGYEGEFVNAVKGAAGVVLQFPFYAGIVGIMTTTGLVNTVTDALISFATPGSFPVIAWVTAGIMNLFIPSAGGEWAVLGGPLLTASAELGVPYGQTLAAYSVGDAHTNLLNPFWALPLLAITGLKAREMFGYAITMLVLLTPFIFLALSFLKY